MRLGVLGPLLICHEGSVMQVPAAMHRAVLAVLLVNANRVVPAGELADVVWDGSPPAGARVTARGYIRRLRRLPGPAVGARIVTRPVGCQAEFGAAEHAAGNAAAARDAWQQALAIFDGLHHADATLHGLR